MARTLHFTLACCVLAAVVAGLSAAGWAGGIGPGSAASAVSYRWARDFPDALRSTRSILLITHRSGTRPGDDPAAYMAVERTVFGMDAGLPAAVARLNMRLGVLPWRTTKALLLLAGDGEPVDANYGLLPLAPNAGYLPPGRDQEQTVGRYLIASLQPGTSSFVLYESVRRLTEMHAEGTAEAFYNLSQCPDRSAAVFGLGGLAGLGDMRALPRATEALLHWDRETASGCSVIEMKLPCLKDPAAAPYVIPLLASPLNHVRHAGIETLKRMGSTLAGAALVQALSDPDLFNRHGALMALAEVFCQDCINYRLPAPAGDIFESDPDRYTQPWRDWWEREGKAKYGKGAGK